MGLSQSNFISRQFTQRKRKVFARHAKGAGTVDVVVLENAADGEADNKTSLLGQHKAAENGQGLELPLVTSKPNASVLVVSKHVSQVMEAKEEQESDGKDTR